jgi:hypothetical protein
MVHAPHQVKKVPSGSSLLGGNFNYIWTTALNNRLKCSCGWRGSSPDGLCFRCDSPCEQFATHAAMIHSDVEPINDYWLEAMLTEMERTGADMLSVVLPIKTQDGITTTAIEDRRTGKLRRLTMTEIGAIPEVTFDAATAGYPDHNLLVSSGLWIADLRNPWVEHNWFEVRDRIFRETKDGQFDHETAAEDWSFSRRMHKMGRKVVASTCVRANHWGEAIYPNDQPWGTCKRDRELPPINWVDAE